MFGKNKSRAIVPGEIPRVTVTNENGKPSTTSLAVAEAFAKRHDDVLRGITNLGCSAEFAARNFAEGSYSDKNWQKRPMYNITRDGFMLLCMGYTGVQAMLMKEAYIAAFNDMEKQIETQLPLLQRELLKLHPDWDNIYYYK